MLLICIGILVSVRKHCKVGSELTTGPIIDKCDYGLVLVVAKYKEWYWPGTRCAEQFGIWINNDKGSIGCIPNKLLITNAKEL